MSTDTEPVDPAGAERWPSAPHSLLEILEASADAAEARAAGRSPTPANVWALPADHPLSVLLDESHVQSGRATQ